MSNGKDAVNRAYGILHKIMEQKGEIKQKNAVQMLVRKMGIHTSTAYDYIGRLVIRGAFEKEGQNFSVLRLGAQPVKEQIPPLLETNHTRLTQPISAPSMLKETLADNQCFDGTKSVIGDTRDKGESGVDAYPIIHNHVKRRIFSKLRDGSTTISSRIPNDVKKQLIIKVESANLCIQNVIDYLVWLILEDEKFWGEVAKACLNPGEK